MSDQATVPETPPEDWRESSEGGLAWLTIPAWAERGAVAAFTTRVGGSSQGHLGELNLSFAVGDDPAAVRDNRRRALAAIGYGLADLVTAGQVHGDSVAPVGRAQAGVGVAEPGCSVASTDALVTAERGVVLSVGCADCVPVYLFDPRRQVIGLAHAGWRGTVAGVAAKTVKAMAEGFGSRAEDLMAAIGPSIGPCCYEVDRAVIDPLKASVPYWRDLIRPGRDGSHWHLDLWAANARQLMDAGIPRAKILVAGLCTSCHSERFFSHRASGGRAGRQMALLVLDRTGPRRSEKESAADPTHQLSPAR